VIFEEYFTTKECVTISLPVLKILRAIRKIRRRTSLDKHHQYSSDLTEIKDTKICRVEGRTQVKKNATVNNGLMSTECTDEPPLRTTDTARITGRGEGRCEEQRFVKYFYIIIFQA
jgi:hypothetical protein